MSKPDQPIEPEIDSLSLYSKEDVRSVNAQCEALGIPRYWKMKHKAKVKRIKELEGDH